MPKICYTNVNKVNVSCIILMEEGDAYMTKMKASSLKSMILTIAIISGLTLVSTKQISESTNPYKMLNNTILTQASVDQTSKDERKSD
ncbi:MAG: hypothetical protein PHY11_02230 [Bacilli bacterium]|nr:hypothetical protein [Bacilli bacterium]MDD4065800.1 hypothetical protein [Bacilli bacterium]